MLITSPRDRCLLCGFTVDAADITGHMRTVHQVTPGERTVVDVPAGRPNWLRAIEPPKGAERELALVGV